MALCAQGHVRAYAGELAAARTAIGELLSLFVSHPDVVLEGMARIVLGLVALTCRRSCRRRWALLPVR